MVSAEYSSPEGDEDEFIAEFMRCLYVTSEDFSESSKEEAEETMGMQDVPPQCADINWVLPPCLHDLRRDYSDLRRLQLKLKMPG